MLKAAMTQTFMTLGLTGSSRTRGNQFKSVLRLAFLCLALTGCARFCGLKHKDMSPEQVVETYLNTAFNMRETSERERLAGLTTGKLRQAINSARDEDIKAAYIDRRYEVKSYSVIERRDRTPRETEITFRLVYADLGSAGAEIAKDTAATVTTDNTVSVVREKGAWFLRDVIGKKTTIDFPVSAENKIEATPGVIGPEPTPVE
ncbi:MAG: hypothetical protein RIQ81_52 [Pseudomonadota bacterium]|jgi:hypothetical protein